MKIIGGYISGIPNLNHIAYKRAGKVDGNGFVSAYSNFEVWNICIAIDIEDSAIIIGKDYQIATRRTGDLG